MKTRAAERQQREKLFSHAIFTLKAKAEVFSLQSSGFVPFLSLRVGRAAGAFYYYGYGMLAQALFLCAPFSSKKEKIFTFTLTHSPPMLWQMPQDVTNISED